MNLPILLTVLAVLVVPFVLGNYLAKRWRMPDYFGKITLVLFTFIAGAAICVLGWNSIKLGIDLRGGAILVYEIMGGDQGAFTADASDPAARQSGGGGGGANMEQLIGALRKRIDPGGVKELTIRPLGSRQIEIIIPEVNPDEVARLRRILGSVGTLEFRILATVRRPEYKTLIDQAAALPMNETALVIGGERVAYWVPVQAGKEEQFVGNPEIGTRTVTRRGKPELQVLVVDDPYDVNGGYLSQARPTQDDKGRLAVGFTFNAAGAERFGSLTAAHLPNRLENFHYLLGIVLDNKLQSAPSIQAAIFNQGIIEGDFTQEAVQEQVDVLNAGALPAALSPEPVSQQEIGPTLGQDTIERGLNSLIFSLILVFAFVLVYYRFAGMVAAFALLMNGVMLLAIMITIKAAFTLPGLAGFALTIAMAVDANVLIFERMREEAARGAALRMVIRNGFERALNAIIDSNLTTLITAVVLYVIGSDQVRGFAVTLFLGIVLSMYTAIFVARVIFDIAERRRWISEVKMMRAIGETRIDFLKQKWLMIGISAVLVAIGLVAVVLRGRGLLDIDFTGGVSVQIVFDQPHEIAQVRKQLEDSQLPDVVVNGVQSRDAAEGTQFIINTSTPPDQEAEGYLVEVKQRVKEIFGGELAHNTLKIGKVGPVTPAAPPTAAPATPAPATPKPTQGARAANPSPQALALSSILLAQAGEKPADKPETKAAEKPEAKTGEKPAAPAPSKAEVPPPGTAEKTPAEKTPVPAPAGKPAPAEPKPVAVDRTQAELEFAYPVTHDGVEQFFQGAIRTAIGEGSAPDLVISNPEYESGSTVALKQWTVEIGLPRDRADAIFQTVVRDVGNSPFYPSSNTIGGAVAKITRDRAVLALLASAVFILLYLWVRFQRLTYGLGAIVSLLHDVLISMGFVALSYYLAKIPFFGSVLLIEPFKVNLVIVTALLTVAGYSLNDTIVIFDRIREVRGKAPQVTEEMFNRSINQTLGRTLLTGVTSIMVIFILYIVGGPTIHGFAYSMLIGVVTGTYSSIYIASPFLLWVSRKSESTRR